MIDKVGPKILNVTFTESDKKDIKDSIVNSLIVSTTALYYNYNLW